MINTSPAERERRGGRHPGEALRLQRAKDGQGPRRQGADRSRPPQSLLESKGFQVNRGDRIANSSKPAGHRGQAVAGCGQVGQGRHPGHHLHVARVARPSPMSSATTTRSRSASWATRASPTSLRCSSRTRRWPTEPWFSQSPQAGAARLARHADHAHRGEERGRPRRRRPAPSPTPLTDASSRATPPPAANIRRNRGPDQAVTAAGPRRKATSLGVTLSGSARDSRVPPGLLASAR